LTIIRRAEPLSLSAFRRHRHVPIKYHEPDGVDVTSALNSCTEDRVERTTRQDMLLTTLSISRIHRAGRRRPACPIVDDTMNPLLPTIATSLVRAAIGRAGLVVSPTARICWRLSMTWAGTAHQGGRTLPGPNSRRPRSDATTAHPAFCCRTRRRRILLRSGGTAGANAVAVLSRNPPIHCLTTH
jgi:hypothetical protein